MERIWTTEIAGHGGARVRLAGWLHHLRRLRGVSFLILRDARGTAQVVVEDPALIERLAGLYHESVLAVEGRVVAEPQAPGGVELREPTVEVIAPASAPPPFDLFRPRLTPPLPTFLDHAALSLCPPRRRALFQLAAACLAAFRTTLRGQGFVEIQTPKLVGR